MPRREGRTQTGSETCERLDVGFINLFSSGGTMEGGAA